MSEPNMAKQPLTYFRAAYMPTTKTSKFFPGLYSQYSMSCHSQVHVGVICKCAHCRYEACIRRLAETLNCVEAANYIRAIDVKCYARHAFPLPRMSKVTSNPAEQANSGLLSLRHFAPLKLMEQLWVYVQQRSRRDILKPMLDRNL